MGAFFAAFVALIIFNGWKIQHNKNLTNKYAEQVIEAYKKYSITVLNFNILTSGINISRLGSNVPLFINEIKSTSEKIELLREDVNKSFEEFKSNLNYYGIISEDSENIQSLIATLNHKFYKINDLELMCAEKTGGFNLVNYRHSSGVYHEQETEDLHRRI